MKTRFQKITSFILALVLMGSLLPMAAFAAGDESAETPAAETAMPVETDAVLPEQSAPPADPKPEVPAASPTATPEPAAPAESPAASESPAPTATEAPVETEQPSETEAPVPSSESPAADVPVEGVPEVPATDAAEPVVALEDILSKKPEVRPEEAVLPWQEDGDVASGVEMITVRYYTADGKTLLKTEEIPKGRTPKASVGPYATVGGKDRLIIGWTPEKMEWSDEAETWNSKFVMYFPMYLPLEKDTNFYAVYAPEFERTNAFVCYYINLVEGGMSLMNWDRVDTTDGGSKPAEKERPEYLQYSISVGGETKSLYFSIHWYDNAEFKGEELDPINSTITKNTVFYGDVGQTYHMVSIESADGKTSTSYPIEDGGTLAEYPDLDKNIFQETTRWNRRIEAETPYMGLRLFEVGKTDDPLTTPVEKNWVLQPFPKDYAVHFYSQDGSRRLETIAADKGDRCYTNYCRAYDGENLIVGWTDHVLTEKERAELWASEDPASKLLFPAEILCGDSDATYYAVYAPADKTIACYYGMGMVITGWGFVMGFEVVEAGQKPKNELPLLIYNDNYVEVEPDDWRLSDKTDPNLFGTEKVKPLEQTITKSTIFWGHFGMGTQGVSFKDGDGNSMGIGSVPVRTGRSLPETIANYPEGTAVIPALPAGATKWKETTTGELFTPEELAAWDHVFAQGEWFTFVPAGGLAVSFYIWEEKGDADPTLIDRVELIPGQKLKAEQIPTEWVWDEEVGLANYVHFWRNEDGEPVDPAWETISGDTSFYAEWEPLDVNPDNNIVLRFEDENGDLLALRVVKRDQKLPAADVPTKNGAGEAITNWLNKSGGFVIVPGVAQTSDQVYTAWYSPGLNSAQHVKYINGKGNGLFEPNGALSRAEAAQIIYSLLKDKSMGPYEVSFPDVPKSEWYYTPVMTLASHRIFMGKDTGKFDPNGAITRAEFVSILCRLFPLEEGSNQFADVKATSWYSNSVSTAAGKGWVLGSKDSASGKDVFKPIDSIRRIEAVTIMNRVLGRAADKAAVDGTERMIFRDVAADHWGFYHVMEASVSHEYTGNATDGETWKTGFSLPYTGMAKGGIRNISGAKYLYYTDADGLLYRKDPGLYKMPDGKYYYFLEDGCFIFKRPSAGVYDMDADPDDDQLGKLYYFQNNLAIRPFQYQTGYDTPVFEHNKNMYYMKQDHSLARKEYVGKLWFGEDGAYTTGDAALDKLVYDFVANFVNADMTQSQKLAALYKYLRDGRDSSGKMLFSYYNWMLKPQETNNNWTINGCASRMLKTGRGDCWHWASMTVLLMRRLGYDADRVIGDLKRYSGGSAPHAWEVITWPDGTKLMYDVQLEWGWIHGYYNVNRYFNLYGMKYEQNQSIGIYVW